ncbi:hypothetical protein HYPSUDRAFT_277411 [Hypholoma sublateritium FD-334 SS-4]|uniref:Uncharacterized protein n=1 Tax=Hypholoma sublateritium (strain FD-334 SS-4) TaxID=945553 RepID=A0A0D2MRA5_HYPSF|nr:hypothetical protein HYPSUDRAFT_277411 [Hypholoma sublateritium FD-334 SS-4]
MWSPFFFSAPLTPYMLQKYSLLFSTDAVHHGHYHGQFAEPHICTKIALQLIPSVHSMESTGMCSVFPYNVPSAFPPNHHHHHYRQPLSICTQSYLLIVEHHLCYFQGST